MPVTARLSKKFYDRFGEDIVTEPVDWFNEVDATYKASLRELNDLNFSRFDSKWEQRLAESEGRLNVRLVSLEAHMDQSFVELTARFDAKLAASEARLRAEIANAKWDSIKMMFAMWASLMIPIIGLWFR